MVHVYTVLKGEGVATTLKVHSTHQCMISVESADVVS